ncbi:MAG: calcium/sodium antiporter [Planctomycetes bacterium]|nr:calcium/sodium antiporter [Planctomycetota bacterium]
MEWYSDPHIALAIVFVLIGFGVLIKGADVLVNGSVVLARRFGLTTAVIGATVVAFGTSLPELMVSVFSCLAAKEAGDVSANGPAAIAIANIIGSNIFNVGMVLGVAALICKMPVPRSSIRLDYPLMLGSFVVLYIFCVAFDETPRINFYEGLILCAGLIAYTFTAVKLGKVDEGEIPPDVYQGMGRAIIYIVLGIILLAIGGELTLNGGIKVAEEIGMSKRVIGLTVMAIGTSLPELVTSIQAARKGETDLAVANIIGSNCFNILSILGVSALIMELPVNAAILTWDFWWMLGLCIIILPAMLFKHVIRRPTAIILVLSLMTYISLLIIMPNLGS